jgi:hypothetical protein
MVKVSVMYPNRADTKFDMTYYLNSTSQWFDGYWDQL